MPDFFLHTPPDSREELLTFTPSPQTAPGFPADAPRFRSLRPKSEQSEAPTAAGHHMNQWATDTDRLKDHCRSA